MVRFRSPVESVAPCDVFAVDAHSVQLTYRGEPGEVRVQIGDRSATADATPGAAVISIAGLDAATGYEAIVTCGSTQHTVPFRTRPAIGPVSFRFATISDLHVGAESFGHFPATNDPSRTDPNEAPYAFRCAEAAIREAVEWGAELLVIKGDLTEYGKVEHWDAVARLLADVSIPVLATPGNHDTWKTADMAAPDGLARAGLSYDPVQIVDRPGIRIILGDTSIPNKGMGSLRQVGPGVVSSAAETTDPVFVGIHHNIQRAPVTWFWPPGITSTNAKSTIAELAEANPNVFMSSGHTHRNRLHNLGPNGSIPFTEVASTSDYPGSWAAYEVSDSTIRQTVRRIAATTAVEWTEATQRAVGGVWPRWSPGRLDDRCVDLTIRR